MYSILILWEEELKEENKLHPIINQAPGWGHQYFREEQGEKGGP